MSNVKISPKWKAIVQRNDGTATALVRAVTMDSDSDKKLSSKEGLRVTVNGRTYILRNAPVSYIK
jgi:hypothetical protein